MSSSSRCSIESSDQLLYQSNKMNLKLYFKQLYILLWKSLLIRRFHYISTFFEIIGPVLMVLGSAAVLSKVNHEQDNSKLQNETLGPVYYSEEWPIKFPLSFRDFNFFYSPQNENTKILVDLLSGLNTKSFKNESDLRDAVSRESSKNFPPPYYRVLGFDFKEIDFELGQLEYQIIFPFSSEFLQKNFQSFPAKYGQEPRYFDSSNDYSFFIGKLSSFINNEFLKKFSKNPIQTDSLKLRRMPYPSYRNSKLTNFSIYDFLALYLLISYTLITPLIVKRITDEKFTKSKEMLRMIGMSDSVFWLSHFINHFIVIFIHSVCFTLILCSYTNPVILYSSGLLLFCFLIFYGIQVILFAMLVTTVFNRPVLASIVMIILWLVISVAIFYGLVPSINQNTIGDESNFVRGLASFLPCGSLILFISIMGCFENNGIGLNFPELSESTVLYGHFSEVTVIILVLLSYPIYVFLIWYLDSVWPFQHGVPKSPFFIFQPSYWIPKKEKRSNVKTVKLNDKVHEPDPTNLSPAIEMNNVTKIFQGMSFHKKVAVDQLLLNIYQNQLTVLLGHNGAGKSTLMNMITGMFRPSSGTIYVQDYNTVTQTNLARQSIGLCPQENINFVELTVYQHLKLFAILKDCPFSKVDSKVKEILEKLQLTEKKNVLAVNLSGGMKRKLQLGMALIGKTKILVLDEPSSGLDPEARRVIWDLLISLRRKRTILLTTHYMEEADVLGDRIAIMNEGKLCCSGSPFFLKNAFGTGYQLRIEKLGNFNSNNFLSVLKTYIPSTFLKSEIETEVIYSFDQKSENKEFVTSVFPNLFKDIENNREQYRINSFGLSYSTLEDVFLLTGSNTDLSHSQKEFNDSEMNQQVYDSRFQLTKHSELVSGPTLFFKQFFSLLIKRFHYARRHWQMVILQLIIPAMIIVFAMRIDNLIQGNNNNVKPIVYDAESLYGTGTKSFYQGPNDYENFYKQINSKYSNQVDLIDQSLIFDRSIIERYFVNLDSYIKKDLYGLQITNNEDFTVWFNAEQIHSIPLALKAFYETMLKFVAPQNLKNNVFIRIVLVPISVKASSSNYNSPNQDVFIKAIFSWIITCLILLPIAFPFLAASYILFPIRERVSKSKLIQLMTGLSPITFWLGSYIFDLLYHLISILILYFVIYLFDTNRLFFNSDSNASASVLFIILFVFGMGTIPMAYLFSYVFKVPSSGFVFYVIILLVFGLIANIFMSVMDLLNNFLNLEVLTWTQFILPLFRFLPIFSMLFGYQKLYKANLFMKICKSFPEGFCQSGMTERFFKGCCPNECKKDDSCYDTGSFAFSKFGSGLEILFLIISGLICFFLIILLETYKQQINKFFSNLIQRIMKKKSNDSSTIVSPDYLLVNPISEDEDVSKERRRIEALTNDFVQLENSPDILMVNNLTKKFGNFLAVDHLSFGVHPEECFGLLGVNGAGKTTTFSMLTGDLFPTAGDAFIKGKHSLIKDLQFFQKNVGYCPQFDALLDNLSGEETLYLMASLRGIPISKIDNDVKKMIQMVDLQQHAKKLVQNYSGGNKRKLSIALALIGNPPLLFLDEPTAGVDPSARRKIWQTLSSIKQIFNSSIILTSHSMEECEALCSRIAIMVSGKFRCLGSTQHLRTKFGQGYSILIRLTRDHETDEHYSQQIKNSLMAKIPSSQLQDYHQCLMNFHVTDTKIKWSTLFEKMAELDEKFSFEDYVISDTTLESIFIMFAKQQNDSITQTTNKN